MQQYRYQALISATQDDIHEVKYKYRILTWITHSISYEGNHSIATLLGVI